MPSILLKTLMGFSLMLTADENAMISVEVLKAKAV
jgi:hypothetical protein